MINDTQQLAHFKKWFRFESNSCYGHTNPVFMDINLADQITKCGFKNLEKLKTIISDYNAKNKI